jgi:hypothetical protein
MEVIKHLIIVVHVGVEVGDGVEAEDHGGHQVVGVEAVAPFQNTTYKKSKHSRELISNMKFFIYISNNIILNLE